MLRLFDSNRNLEMQTCDCSLSYVTVKVQTTLENVNINRKELLDLHYSFNNEFIIKYILLKLMNFWQLSIGSVLHVMFR